jgi:hypothetical protein
MVRSNDHPRWSYTHVQFYIREGSQVTMPGKK